MPDMEGHSPLCGVLLFSSAFAISLSLSMTIIVLLVETPVHHFPRAAGLGKA